MATVFGTYTAQEEKNEKEVHENIIDKLYIVIDYNAKGERGNDAKRDIIKFETPPYKKGKVTYSKDANNLIKKEPAWQLEINKTIQNDFKIKSNKNKAGIDTLFPIGWKGIYADDIADAYNQIVAYLGIDKKVKTIVIRTHGAIDADRNINNEDKTIYMSIDNNWVYLTKDEQIKSGKKSDNINSKAMQEYAEKGTCTSFYDADKNIKTLIGISEYVKDGGDLVLGSCHSAFNDNFILPLQKITGSRLNVYGIYFLSSFQQTGNIEVDYMVITQKDKGKEYPTIKAKENIKNEGITYITADRFFSDNSILSPVDINGDPTTNYAYKYPVGGSKPIKLNDLKLNKNGLSY